MLRLAGILILLLLMLFSATVYLLDIDPRSLEPSKQAERASKQDDAKAPTEIHYGKFLFPLADELRQMIGVVSFARTNRLDLRAPMPYNRFKDTIADRLGEYLKANGIVRQKPHPFPLHKKWEAARAHSEADLFAALAAVADLEIKRKSGGIPVDVGMESFLLSKL